MTKNKFKLSNLYRLSIISVCVLIAFILPLSDVLSMETNNPDHPVSNSEKDTNHASFEGVTQIVYPNFPHDNSFAIKGRLAERFVTFFSRTSTTSTAEEFSEIIILFLNSWSVDVFKAGSTLPRRIL